MIPSDPKKLEQMKKLAERNIANGDWGDEVTFPGEDMPLAPEDREAQGTVSRILSEMGGLRLPKRK